MRRESEYNAAFSFMATVSNNQDLLSWPGVQVSWTPYDPTDLFSDSIDPLGFGRGYITLADHLLPGFTTITVVPRYTSMLCAAIRAAAPRSPDGAPPSRDRAQVLSAVKSYERAWALACALASEDGLGESAILGVRGIRSVQRFLTRASGQRTFRTSDFTLLYNQVRYGGIGAYASLLDECHLARMQELTLTTVGMELAEAFPAPPSGFKVGQEDADLRKSGLIEWGRRANPSVFTDVEARPLRSALSGEYQGNHSDRLRWTALRMLASLPQQQESELLGNWLISFRRSDFIRANMPAECVDEIHATLPILIAHEKFYQIALYVFEFIRSAVTQSANVPLAEILREPHVIDAVVRLRRRARGIFGALGTAKRIDRDTTAQIEKVLTESGTIKLASDMKEVDAPAAVQNLLARHRDVQSGKFDGALRKSPWIREEKASLRLSAQRHQLPLSKRPASWKAVAWHPFRTDAAYEFIRACGIKR